MQERLEKWRAQLKDGNRKKEKDYPNTKQKNPPYVARRCYGDETEENNYDANSERRGH